MQAFEYAHPRSVTEALPLLGSRWGETEILAGGTDLLSLMKNYVVTPKRVVNIKGLRELSGIRATPAGIHIGALMTLEELRTSQPMHEYPALAQAAAGVTSPQIRNMGTVGGRSEEHTSELQSRPHLVCRLLLEKKKKTHGCVNFTSSEAMSTAKCIAVLG